MLVELLRRIAAADGLVPVSAIAADLGSTAQTVRMMIEDLTRRGYLEEVSIACPSGDCGDGCGSCAVAASARTWTVAPRGQRLIGKPA